MLHQASILGFDPLEPSKHVVGISDMKVAQDPCACIVTHCLGSCIAVVVCDVAASIGGLLHFQLPSAAEGAGERIRNPLMYSDTGIPMLIDGMRTKGASLTRLVVKLFGGANILDKDGFFNIGKRNHIAAKRVLWRLGCFVTAEDVGGDSWRTVILEVKTGVVTVRNSVSEYKV